MQLLYNNASFPEIPTLSLNEYILAIAGSGALQNHAVVIPTYRKIRELERELTDEHFLRTEQPLTHLPLFTMQTFTRSLYDKLAPGRREATMEIQIALMERAMKNVDLSYYARPGKDPSLGVVEQITRVISGVRADGILPTQFSNDVQAVRNDPEGLPGYDIVKLQDLYNIYSEYLRILGDTWIDYPGRMLRVNTELFKDHDAVFRAAFPEVQTLLIHGHTEFTQPEIDMLIRLSFVSDLNILIFFDYNEGNGPLYGNFGEVIEKLALTCYKRKDLEPIDPETPEEERSPFTLHMRRNLFRTDERIENSAFDDRIAAYSFHTREEEVRGIAGLIKSLVQEEGIQPEQICVSTLVMDTYTELFREVFPSYGIPANITARFPLEQNGLVTALFSALNILAENYDRRDVLRAVTSPYLSFGPEVDPAALADASTKLRITRGYQTWKRRIGRRVDFLTVRLRTLLDPDERRTLELELETLERAATSIESIHHTLSDFSLRQTPVEFREAFLKLIAWLKATENVLELRRNLDAQTRNPADRQRIHDEMERDTRALSRFLGLLDELTELFELDAQEAAGTEAEQESTDSTDVAGTTTQEPTPESETDTEELIHRLDYYLSHLRTAAARSYYTLREKHDYGVLVTPLDQIQGLKYEVMIICGLVDGEFPSTYIPANFLGKPLEKTEERQLRRERIAFYTGLIASEQKIYLTYPRTSGENELVRSSFLDALLRITTVEKNNRLVEFRELRREREERRTAEPESPDRDFPAFIETLEELSEEAGKALWNGRQIPRIQDQDGERILEHLKHTVAVEIARRDATEDPTRAPEYRGIIGSALTEEEQQKLAERRHSEYSASQLELYARCPFKYFAQRLIRAEAPRNYDVSLTPLERGFLLHTVLFRLYSELRDRDELPITEEICTQAFHRAQQIAEEEIEGIALDHPYWRIDRERLLGSDVLHGLLEQWIESEVGRTGDKTELIPQFFEVGFGKSGSGSTASDPLLSRNEEVELYTIKVRGKVDRVEILHRGDDVFYAVADYKTGQPPTRGDIENGLSLQLILYLEVIRHILADHFGLPLEHIKPAGGIYYRLNARDVNTKDTYLLVPNELKGDVIRERKYKRDPDSTEALEQRMEEAFAFAEQYVAGIATGNYHVTTHQVNKVCRGCEYHSVCRVWEVGRPEGE